MLLSDRSLKTMLGIGYKYENIQPASVDITLANNLKVQLLSNAPCSLKSLPKFDYVPEPYILHPDRFYLGSTIEYFSIPLTHAVKVEGKSSLGRIGLMVHSTAGWIDPGFNGNITLELKVVGTQPVEISPGDLIGQVCVFELDHTVLKGYCGKYQYQSGITEAKY